MLPAISQRLLVNQSAVADPQQPGQVVADGMSGVQFAQPGVAVAGAEKLGLLSSTHFINWSAGVLAGEVTIEVADEAMYTGPWIPLAVINFASGIISNLSAVSGFGSGALAPRQDVVKIDGAFAAFRHRITSPVAGGSVSTKIVGTT